MNNNRSQLIIPFRKLTIYIHSQMDLKLFFFMDSVTTEKQKPEMNSI